MSLLRITIRGKAPPDHPLGCKMVVSCIMGERHIIQNAKTSRSDVRLGFFYRRVRFAQGITGIVIGVGSRFHLEAQVFLPGLCLLQPLGVVLMPVVVFLQLIVRRHQRPAVLLHGTLLLGEFLSRHRQLGFRARDGLFVVLYASPGQTEGGLGFRICWLMVRILREKLLESSDSATTSLRRVSAIKVHLSLIAGDSGIMVEYWLGASARLSGFTEQTTVLQFPLEDLK